MNPRMIDEMSMNVQHVVVLIQRTITKVESATIVMTVEHVGKVSNQLILI